MPWACDPASDARELAKCIRPWLIGVRHHSAALARVVPELLDAFVPELLLVELPAELAPWLPWLAHRELRAPVALAADAPALLGFYPFADFSPELAAVRWAVERADSLWERSRPPPARK